MINPTPHLLPIPKCMALRSELTAVYHGDGLVVRFILCLSCIHISLSTSFDPGDHISVDHSSEFVVFVAFINSTNRVA